MNNQTQDHGERPLVVLSAGGTGGHLFPAEALAVELKRRGYRVMLATDTRAADYAGEFPAEAIHAFPSATPMKAGVREKSHAMLRLLDGLRQAWQLFGRVRPALVIGFGGYPTVPPLLAAQIRGIPTLIHEQNSVMGRANRLLSRRCRALATGFPDVSGIPPRISAILRWTGNPLRPVVVTQAAKPYDSPSQDGDLRLLVFGGSQGARVMADIVPLALEQLDVALRARLVVTQQARAEDAERVEQMYAQAGIRCEIAPFFDDLPVKMSQAHLVISRSGASTVAELAAIGRPAILVPLPDALDQDQAANAATLSAVGAALAMPQVSFTPMWLARELETLLLHPSRLTKMALAAKGRGILDASTRLADFVDESVGRG